MQRVDPSTERVLGREAEMRALACERRLPAAGAVGAPVAWQPVVGAGWVYPGLADGSLVGFATGDVGDDGWPMWGGGPGHNGCAS